MAMLATADVAARTRPGWRFRASAVLLVMMASLVIIGSVGGSGTPAYVLALVSSLAVVTLWLCGQMWDRQTFRTAIAADSLALLTMITQLLVAMIGGPGVSNPDPHWSPASVGVVTCAFAVLVLLAADSPHTRSEDDEPEHPYAL